MDEKMKTTLLAVFCVLVILASFIGMQYISSMNNKQTVNFNNVTFSSPNGYEYVNGSSATEDNSVSNESSFNKITLRNQDDLIEIKQYSDVLEILSGNSKNMNGITVYKNTTKSDNSYNQYFFNFNGQGYEITTPSGNDQLIEAIVNSMEERQ